MKPMKYSNPSVRDRGGGHWQTRFRYKEGDKWRTLSRNLEATSKRDANKKATQQIGRASCRERVCSWV